MTLNSEKNVPIMFSQTQGLDAQPSEKNSPTLRAGGSGMAVIYPIDDAREIQKHQNGTGVWADVVLRDREGKSGGGKGPLVSETAFTPATSNFHTVFPNAAIVRRLTPTECERLQGFPDGWTDGQADSNRYKQMGNAVAVPVVQWIINRLVREI